MKDETFSTKQVEHFDRQKKTYGVAFDGNRNLFSRPATDLEHGYRNKLHSIAVKFHLEPDLSQFSHLSREFCAISATIDAKKKNI